MRGKARGNMIVIVLDSMCDCDSEQLLMQWFLGIGMEGANLYRNGFISSV